MKEKREDAHVYFPVKLLNDVRKMARENRRSLSAEIVIAAESKVREWKLRNGEQK